MKDDKLMRLMRLGLLEEKKKKRQQEDVRIDRLVKDITYHLYMVEGVKSIKMDAASQAMEELKAAYARWEGLNKEIAELEEEE